MDWNWFFSSMSQSAAAIVGIFGAFIVSKVLSNQAAFAQKSVRLSELITESRKIVDVANGRYFDWYNKRIDGEALKDIEDILNKVPSEEEEESEAVKLFEIYVVDDKPEALTEHLYEEVNSFSMFTSRETAFKKIADLLSSRRTKEVERNQARRKRYDELTRNAHRKNFLGGLSTMSVIPQDPGTVIGMAEQAPIPPPREYMSRELRGKLTDELEAIEEVMRSTRHNVRVISDFLKLIHGNPEFSREITYSILLVMALFLVGVVFPLSVMPVPEDQGVSLSLMAFFDIIWSLQGLLLTLVSTIFFSIVVIFYRINSSLRYPISEVATLRSYTEPSAYSEYFQIYDENLTIAEARQMAQEAAEKSP